jgi:opacity protein-like surface antigen
MKRAGWVLILALLAVPATAVAQKVELAVTGGGYFPTGTRANVGNAAAIEGTFAYRVFHVPLISLYGEVPVARTFDAGLNAINGSYTGTFVTPGLKVKIAPAFFVSPYFSAGVGVAHFDASGRNGGASINRSNNSLAYGLAGGLDMKIFPFVSLRGEIRDFNSGGLGFVVPGVSGRQNNLVASAGIVLRF